MIYSENINNVLIENPILKKMCKENNFVMRQHSDALKANTFDHLTFVGTETIDNALKRDQSLISIKNKCVTETYRQMFMSSQVYDENKKYMDKLKSKDLYTIIDDYSEMFNGMLSVDKYLVLANSNVFNNKYPVFILIDSESQNMKIGPKKKELEFYGLVCIGFLADISPYVEEELIEFEKKINFSIPEAIRSYLLKHSTVEHERKLYRFDLETIEESLNIKFNKASKNVNNFHLLKDIENSTVETRNKTILDNNNFIKHMNEGFLYLGLIKTENIMHNGMECIKQKEELYCLLNFEEQRGIDFSFTLWNKTCINGNADKLCNLSVSNLSEKELHLELDKIDINNPSRIIYSIKCVTDVCL